MNHHDCNGHDDDGWGDIMQPPPYSYTLKLIDFVGIGLNGLALAVAGLGNGAHYILQMSARECFMAAAGQRERAHQRAERKRLEEYAASFDTKELEG